MEITTVVTEILVMQIFNNVQCIVVRKPEDAVAKIGDIVIMNCSSTYGSDVCGKITWNYFEMNSDSGDIINIGSILSRSFTSYISIIDSTAGNCHLRIVATPSAAGRYECFDGTGTSGDAIAALIVLDPKVSEQSHDNMATNLECSVRYYGNWAPKVQWTKTSGDSWDIAASNDSEISKNPVSSTITIGATQQFMCKVRVFEPGKLNTFLFDWMSRPYSLKNLANPNSGDRAWDKGIGIGFAICLAIFCLIGIAYLIFKRGQRRCIKEKGTNPPAEDL